MRRCPFNKEIRCGYLMPGEKICHDCYDCWIWIKKGQRRLMDFFSLETSRLQRAGVAS